VLLQKTTEAIGAARHHHDELMAQWSALSEELEAM
jgi:hypothetical protein